MNPCAWQRYLLCNGWLVAMEAFQNRLRRIRDDSCRRSTMQFKVLQVRHQPSDQGEVGDIWDPCHDVNAIHSLVHTRRLGLWASHIATCLLGGVAAALTTLLSCHPTHRLLLRGVIRGQRVALLHGTRDYDACCFLKRPSKRRNQIPQSRRSPKSNP